MVHFSHPPLNLVLPQALPTEVQKHLLLFPNLQLMWVHLNASRVLHADL